MGEQYIINVANLGDVTGCTLVANCTEVISVEQAASLRDHLKNELPEAAHILVVCNGVDVSVKADDEREGYRFKGSAALAREY